MDQPPPIDNTFGAILIGVILCAVLYGVSCAQAFYYFLHYSKKDGLGTKAVVVAALISDTVHQTLISHSIYTYTITYYSQPQKLGVIVWSLVVEVIFNGITGLLVQTFFAVRIWKFSQKNVAVTVTLSIFIVAEFVSVSAVYVAKSINMTTFTELAGLRSLSVTVNALAVAGDVLITIAFCVLLHGARTGIQRSNTMINMLIIFSVQTGMLTCLCAAGALISIVVSPDTFIYACFYFLSGRLYYNSLLATLNVRRKIGGKGHGDLGISLRPFDNSNSSAANNHKEVDIKSEIAGVESHRYITSVKAHGGNGSSSFVRPASRANNFWVAGTGSEHESGRSRHPETSIILNAPSSTGHISAESTD